MRVKVHQFIMGDVDEVYLYASAGIHEWLEQSPIGQWCKQRDLELDYTTSYVENHYATTISVFADMNEHDQTLFHLKFG